jgi:hypothetical protein
MTSLLDPVAFPAAAFAELYHGRWRIEEAFKRIKHRLQLEHTSGLSWHAARQDFGAKAVFDNLNALAAYVATDALIDPVRPTRSTAPWPSTRSSDRSAVGSWLQPPPLAASSRILEEIALNLQKFVPNRSQPRKPQPKPHLSHAYK